MKKEQKTSRSPNVLLNDERAEPAASLDSNFDLTTYVGFADEFQFYAPFDNNGNVSATDHEIA